VATLLPTAVASAIYDPANEQTSFAGQLLEYDANGNLWKEKDGTGTVLRQYNWDARNRLIGITGNVTTDFKYDVLGRRINKTVNNVTLEFGYDGKDIVTEIGGGAVGANYLRSLNIDELFIRQTSAENEHYHTDALGSLLVLTSASGTQLVSYGYEAFGKTAVTGNSANAFQYTGRDNDGTELYYYRARYYSPTRGRFTKEDPILVPFIPQDIGMCRSANNSLWTLPGLIGAADETISQRLNPYPYVINNPIQFKDPSGLQQCAAQKAQCGKELANTYYQNGAGAACAKYLFAQVEACGDGAPASCYVNATILANNYCAGLNPSIKVMPGSCVDAPDSYFVCSSYTKDPNPTLRPRSKN
jgi:RHS repeat-associated protein